jgi:glyoxylase-like metal-dependent hydrolase (beta-lactamase superfamily II)
MIKIQIIGYSPCSSYFVGNDDEGYLVDCPVLGDLDSFIRFTDIQLRGIILTHCHADHLTNIHEIKKKYNIPVIAHKGDKVLAASLPVQYQFIYGSNGPKMSTNPLSIDQYVEDRDVLTIGSDTIEVIHTPGHSPGCIMLYIPSCNSLMSGDTIFDNNIGRTDFPLSNKEDFIKSINEKVLPLDDNLKVYSGHNDSFEDYFILGNWKTQWDSLKQYVVD